MRSALSPEDAMAEGAELAAGPAAPLAGPAFPAAAPQAIGPVEVTAPAEVTRPGPVRPANGAADGTYLGLPRRARMANLAPQLRGQPRASQPSSDPLQPREVAGSPARSPEQTGSRLSELQDGWLRGRLDDLDSPDIAPPGLHLSGRPEDASGKEAEPDDREGAS